MVGYTNEPRSAFKWTAAGGWQTLPGLAGATANGARAISDDGTEIWDAASGTRVLQTVLMELGAELTGWSDLRITDVSATGKVIVGNGLHAGKNEGWVAQLP